MRAPPMVVVVVVVVVGILVGTIAHAHAQAAHAPGAYVIVVDRSTSMRGDKLALVKSAVLDAAMTLQPTDQVAIVAVAETARVIAPLQAPSRRRLAARLAGLQVARGDNLGAGLDAALSLLATQQVATRHVLVVTDDDSPLGLRLDGALARLRELRISASAVGVGTSSHAVATAIAGDGADRAFQVDQLEMLPRTLAAGIRAPVVYDGAAVVFAIDCSGSTNGPKLELAKEAARVAAAALQPDDLFGAVAFDVEADTVVALQRAGNRARIASDVTRLQGGGGTNIFVGLRAASEMLRGITNRTKLVILVSDGDANADGIADLVEDMASHGISVTSLGLPGADRALLSQIADLGHGRLYMIDDLGGLPRNLVPGRTP